MTNDYIPPEHQMVRVEDLAHAQPGAGNGKGDSSAGAPIASGGGGGTTIAIRPREPALFVEQMPVYNGDLNAFISKNIQYPELARTNGIEGRVAVQFVVNEDGSITDVKVTRGIGGGCDEEAVRVIKSMPKWKPGRNNGVPVKVYFTQPITFRLSE